MKWIWMSVAVTLITAITVIICFNLWLGNMCWCIYLLWGLMVLLAAYLGGSFYLVYLFITNHYKKQISDYLEEQMNTIKEMNKASAIKYETRMKGIEDSIEKINKTLKEYKIQF